MQIIKLHILILSLLFNSGNSGDLYVFCKEYKNDIKHAGYHYSNIRNEIFNHSKIFKTDSTIISAVVFPELIRYSIFRDFCETNLMEFSYIEYGSGISDFSLGMFQIKPSFVELLEKEVAFNQNLNEYKFICHYKSDIIKEVRKERIDRLKSITWQIKYLNCFYSLMELNFNHIEFNNISEKIRFYSTCYNHGFNCKEAEIYKWEKIKTFPNGYNSEKENYCYSDIALLFYKYIL